MKQVRAPLASDLITELNQSAAHEWRSSLACDRHDPFFYDHALDHVPGMALVEACLQTVEHATARRDTSAGASFFAAVGFEFQRFCEHGAQAEVCVKTSKAQPNHWSVQVTQHGALLTSGTVITRAITDFPAAAATRAPESPRAELALVHKVETDNVLVGPMTIGSDALPEASVIAPTLRDVWAGQAGGQRSAGELIEAGRQFGTLLMHAVTGMSFESQFVLQNFNMVLDRPVYRCEPVQVLARPGLLIRHHIRGMELVRVGGRIVGHMDFSALLLPRAVYSRLRKNASEVNGTSRQFAADQRSA